MLSDVKEELVNTLTLTISLADINEHMISELNKLTAHKGKVRMRFRIIDPVDHVAVNMYSRAKRIHLTDELMNYLRDSAFIQHYALA